MARIRTVKPQLFFDEELAELSIATRYFFIGLFTQADKEGRLEDRPKMLKANIFPYENIDVEKMLSELDRGGFIHRYAVNGAQFIQIDKFAEHQRISGKELVLESHIPPMDSTGEALVKHLGSTWEAPGKHLGRQERKGVQERSTGKEIRTIAPSPSDSEPAVLTFPVVGKEKDWSLTASKVKEYSESFPGVDVLSECRTARQWCIDNPSRRKTFRGMPAFLSRWLAKAQNSGRARKGGYIDSKPSAEPGKYARALAEQRAAKETASTTL